MRFEIENKGVFAATGGKPPRSEGPLIVFLHGAGMDHSVFALQSRWFAHHGRRVLAVDFPGHGASEGPPLADIEALARWTATLIEAQGGKAALVGHSMGALVALSTAARYPELVSAIALIGVGEKMPVHPDLIAAAKAGESAAIDMVSIWGLGAAAIRAASPTPGGWLLGASQRLLERAPPGVLHADLAACNAYARAIDDAGLVACPATFVLGERDQMTPAKSGAALAARIPGARVVSIPGAGHLLPVERPAETLHALRAAFPV